MEQYDDIQLVGRGAFATVRLVRRISDQQLFVIKTFSVPLGDLDTHGRTELAQEVKLLAHLHHPNIVDFEDFFIDANGAAHLVMEYCPGGTLHAALQSRHGELLPEERVWEAFVQVADALRYVHGANVLHRDLKSTNILLSGPSPEYRVVKLGDFGIAKVLGDQRELAATVVGTPFYLSPEVASGRAYDGKSDVWALGVVLYEMLALHRPFEASNLPAVIFAIMKAQPPPLPGEYSPEIKELVGKMMAKDPDARPTIAEIMAMPLVRYHVERWERTRLALDAETVSGRREESTPSIAGASRLDTAANLIAEAGTGLRGTGLPVETPFLGARGMPLGTSSPSVSARGGPGGWAMGPLPVPSWAVRREGAASDLAAAVERAQAKIGARPMFGQPGPAPAGPGMAAGRLTGGIGVGLSSFTSSRPPSGGMPTGDGNNHGSMASTGQSSVSGGLMSSRAGWGTAAAVKPAAVPMAAGRAPVGVAAGWREAPSDSPPLEAVTDPAVREWMYVNSSLERVYDVLGRFRLRTVEARKIKHDVARHGRTMSFATAWDETLPGDSADWSHVLDLPEVSNVDYDDAELRFKTLLQKLPAEMAALLAARVELMTVQQDIVEQDHQARAASGLPEGEEDSDEFESGSPRDAATGRSSGRAREAGGIPGAIWEAIARGWSSLFAWHLAAACMRRAVARRHAAFPPTLNAVELLGMLLTRAAVLASVTAHSGRPDVALVVARTAHRKPGGVDTTTVSMSNLRGPSPEMSSGTRSGGSGGQAATAPPPAVAKAGLMGGGAASETYAEEGEESDSDQAERTTSPERTGSGQETSPDQTGTGSGSDSRPTTHASRASPLPQALHIVGDLLLRPSPQAQDNASPDGYGRSWPTPAGQSGGMHTPPILIGVEGTPLPGFTPATPTPLEAAQLEWKDLAVQIMEEGLRLITRMMSLGATRNRYMIAAEAYRMRAWCGLQPPGMGLVHDLEEAARLYTLAHEGDAESEPASPPCDNLIAAIALQAIVINGRTSEVRRLRQMAQEAEHWSDVRKSLVPSDILRWVVVVDARFLRFLLSGAPGKRPSGSVDSGSSAGGSGPKPSGAADKSKDKDKDKDSDAELSADRIAQEYKTELGIGGNDLLRQATLGELQCIVDLAHSRLKALEEQVMELVEAGLGPVPTVPPIQQAHPPLSGGSGRSQPRSDSESPPEAATHRSVSASGLSGPMHGPSASGSGSSGLTGVGGVGTTTLSRGDDSALSGESSALSGGSDVYVLTMQSLDWINTVYTRAKAVLEALLTKFEQGSMSAYGAAVGTSVPSAVVDMMAGMAPSEYLPMPSMAGSGPPRTSPPQLGVGPSPISAAAGAAGLRTAGGVLQPPAAGGRGAGAGLSHTPVQAAAAGAAGMLAAIPEGPYEAASLSTSGYSDLIAASVPAAAQQGLVPSAAGPAPAAEVGPVTGGLGAPTAAGGAGPPIQQQVPAALLQPFVPSSSTEYSAAGAMSNIDGLPAAMVHSVHGPAAASRQAHVGQPSTQATPGADGSQQGQLLGILRNMGPPGQDAASGGGVSMLAAGGALGPLVAPGKPAADPGRARLLGPGRSLSRPSALPVSQPPEEVGQPGAASFVHVPAASAPSVAGSGVGGPGPGPGLTQPGTVAAGGNGRSTSVGRPFRPSHLSTVMTGAGQTSELMHGDAGPASAAPGAVVGGPRHGWKSVTHAQQGGSERLLSPPDATRPASAEAARAPLNPFARSTPHALRFSPALVQPAQGGNGRHRLSSGGSSIIAAAGSSSDGSIAGGFAASGMARSTSERVLDAHPLMTDAERHTAIARSLAAPSDAGMAAPGMVRPVASSPALDVVASAAAGPAVAAFALAEATSSPQRAARPQLQMQTTVLTSIDIAAPPKPVLTQQGAAMLPTVAAGPMAAPAGQATSEASPPGQAPARASLRSRFKRWLHGDS